MTKLFFAGALTLLLTGGAAAAPGTAVSTVNLRAESNTTGGPSWWFSLRPCDELAQYRAAIRRHRCGPIAPARFERL